MNLQLVPCDARHARPLYEAVRESITELSKWMPWCHPAYCLAESEHWVKASTDTRSSGAAYEFVIEEDGEVLGCCGLNHVDRTDMRCNLGYWVRDSQTRRGIATRAVRLLADWALRETDLIRLEILIDVDNRASQGVAEKAGAFREGVLRSRLMSHGRPHDAVLYSIVREGSGSA